MLDVELKVQAHIQEHSKSTKGKAVKETTQLHLHAQAASSSCTVMATVDELSSVRAILQNKGFVVGVNVIQKGTADQLVHTLKRMDEASTVLEHGSPLHPAQIEVCTKDFATTWSLTSKKRQQVVSMDPIFKPKLAESNAKAIGKIALNLVADRAEVRDAFFKTVVFKDPTLVSVKDGVDTIAVGKLVLAPIVGKVKSSMTEELTDEKSIVLLQTEDAKVFIDRSCCNANETSPFWFIQRSSKPNMVKDYITVNLNIDKKKTEVTIPVWKNNVVLKPGDRLSSELTEED